MIDSLGDNLQIILLIGSASRPETFTHASDIDLCLFIKDSCVLSELKEDFYSYLKLKKLQTIMIPKLIDDYQGKRVESFIKINNMTYDLTFKLTELPQIGTSINDIVNDNLEIHIGSIYKYGIPVFGDVRNYELTKKDLFPYYNDNLRKHRLSILQEKITSLIIDLRRRVDLRSNETFDRFLLLRKLFLQWLFIYKKDYPWSYTKSVGRQLELLKLSESTIRRLIFSNDESAYQSVQSFILLAENFLRGTPEEETI